MRRPLAVAGLSLMFSIILASYLSLNVSICIGAVAVLFAAVILFIKSVPKALPVCLLFCAAGMFVYSLTVSLVQLPLERSYGGQVCAVTGVVEGEGEESYGNIRYKVKVESVNGKEEDFYLRLTTDGDTVITPYSRIAFDTTLKIPENISGLQFNSRNSLLADGYTFTCYCESSFISVIGFEFESWYTCFLDIRKTIIESLDSLLGEYSPIARAITLGDVSKLTPEQDEAFRRTGVYHLFSVSGLHLSVILAAYLFLSRKLRINRIISYSLGILLILAFMAITGFPLSVIRAGIMGILTLIALMIFREADPFNSLGVAITVIIMINPFSALDIGFLMSVLATLGLILISPRMMPTLFENKPIEEKKQSEEEDEEAKPTVFDYVKVWLKKAAKFIVASFVTSISANIFLLPFYAYFFGSISILMPVANLLLVPLGSGILILSFISVLLSLIPFIGGYLAFLFALLDKLFIIITDFICIKLGSIGFGQIALSSLCGQITVIFIVIAVILWINKKVTRISGVMAALCCLSVFICGAFSSYIFNKDVAKLYFWGTRSSSCAVINQNGSSVIFSPDGFYSEYVAESYRCVDGCFDYTTLDFESEDKSVTIKGWDTEIIPCDGECLALILSNGESDILLVNKPNEELTKKILDKDITFDIVFFADGYDTVTRLITEKKIADTVIYIGGNGSFSQTKGKLYALFYNVIDITDTDGISVSLDMKGNYKING